MTSVQALNSLAERAPHPPRALAERRAAGAQLAGRARLTSPRALAERAEAFSAGAQLAMECAVELMDRSIRQLLCVS
jgi:hypothetical protein